MKRKILKTAIISAVGFIVAIASSQASLTSVNDIYGVNGAGGEWNLYNSGIGSVPGTGVMEYIYGVGHFSRVDDSGDALWVGVNGQIQFQAVYAGAQQNLYTADPSGSPISPLILTAQGTSGTPSRSGFVTTFTPITQPFLFLDDTSPSGYAQAYSEASLNGGVDRMVTFAVSGYLATAGLASSYTAFTDGTHYVLGFEDYTDFDYNDLVVELAGVAPMPDAGVAVPESGIPLVLIGGLWAGLLVLGYRQRVPVITL